MPIGFATVLSLSFGFIQNHIEHISIRGSHFKIMRHSQTTERATLYAKRALRACIHSVKIPSQYFFPCYAFCRKYIYRRIGAGFFTYTACRAAVQIIFIVDEFNSASKSVVHFFYSISNIHHLTLPISYWMRLRCAIPAEQS